MNYKTYGCTSCGAAFINSGKVLFCPVCGSDKVQIGGKARETALKLIDEHNQLFEKMLNKYDEYAQLLAEVEYIRGTLRVYKSRGIIESTEMPNFEKPRLIDYVKRYKKEKRQSS